MKKSHRGFCPDILEKSTKEWPVGSHIIMNIAPRVPCEIPLIETGYKYRSQKVLGSIATELYRSNEPDVAYLSCFPDKYTNVSICLVVNP